jgi:hypothetical protein
MHFVIVGGRLEIDPDRSVIGLWSTIDHSVIVR